MQITSELHKSLLRNLDHIKETRVEIAGVWYGESDIQDLSTSGALFADDTPSVGGCRARTMKLVAWVQSESIPRGAQIRIEQRLILPDYRTGGIISAAEWIPKGTFYVASRSIDRATGAITFSGYDGMRKADGQFVSDSDTGEWPRPCDQVVAAIAQRMGVAVDSRTVLDPSVMVDYPNDYTMREVLGYIAAAHAGNWIITDANELRLIGLCEIPEETSYLIDEYGDVIAFGGVRIIV